MTPGKIVFTNLLGYLGSSYLYVHRSNVTAFVDGRERNVRYKLSTALTSPHKVTNNDAIDSRYFLESH